MRRIVVYGSTYVFSLHWLSVSESLEVILSIPFVGIMNPSSIDIGQDGMSD